MARCCFCNRPLTNSESIRLGFGPSCASLAGWKHNPQGTTSNNKLIDTSYPGVVLRRSASGARSTNIPQHWIKYSSEGYEWGGEIATAGARDLAINILIKYGLMPDEVETLHTKFYSEFLADISPDDREIFIPQDRILSWINVYQRQLSLFAENEHITINQEKNK